VLTNAAFIWSEPHSKRVKVQITIQKEIFSSAILQQSFVVEFVQYNQMCDDCRRVQAKDYWRACVQVRQRCDFKRTLFYLEQLLIKHNAHKLANKIKPVPTGLDFYYARQQDAKKMVEFISTVLPCKSHNSQQLVTHDIKNNFYDYKHTFCVDIVPITKHALICLPKHVSHRCGNISQFVLCLRVTNVISLIDPATAQTSEVTATAYWKDPFEIFMHPKELVEFFVLEVEDTLEITLPSGHGHVSSKHHIADAWVVRSHQLGMQNAQPLHCRTYLGHIIKPGDTVLGYDITNSNLNSATFDSIKSECVPDVILVRKVYNRARARKWKLRRIFDQDETSSLLGEFNAFLDDIEEDKLLRERVNIYKKEMITSTVTTVDDDDEAIPETPNLAEMLDDLDLNSTVDNNRDIQMDD